MEFRDPPPSPLDVLVRNVTDVRNRIEHAARRAGRDRALVQLVAVTKTVSPETMLLLPQSGLSEIGENRVQIAEAKWSALGETTARGFRWHMIGHLQRNKARRALAIFSMIHSVDSERLLRHLAALADERDEGPVDVLLELHVSGEEAKQGLPVERTKDCLALASGLPGVRVRGFMGMAPLSDDPESARLPFRTLRLVLERANRKAWYRAPLSELSMGMSNDFEIAVEEGATIVRVGRAIFRDLSASDPDGGA